MEWLNFFESNLFSNIINTFSAIGTIGAVIVSYFLKTDPTFSRCIFSRRSDHGMVCGYI